MKKKTLFMCLLAIFSVGVFMSGCSGKKEDLNLVFYEQKEDMMFYPYVAKWNTDAGEVTFSDTALRVSLLPLNYQPQIVYENKWFAKDVSDKTGTNIYVRKEEGIHNYHVQLTSSSEFKNIELPKPEEVSDKIWEQAFLLKADYDLDSEEITFLLCRNLESSGIMIVGKAKGQQNMDFSWQIFEFESGFPLEMQTGNVVMAGNWIYGSNGEHPVRISLEDGAVEVLEHLEQEVKALVPDKKEEEMDYIRQILPVGRYQDSVIWKWDVISSKENEPLFCLFKEQAFTGAIHVQNNGNWKVYDKEKNISDIDMSMVYRNELYLPQ